MAALKTRTRGTEQKRSAGGIKKTPKWAPKCSKIDGKSGPGGSKNDPKWLLGRSWGALGALLGSPGPLGRLLVSLGALLGRSWGVPGSSWCRLGSLPGRPGALLGVILGSRGAPFGAFLVSFEGWIAISRKHRKSMVFQRFFKVFQGSGLPKSFQNRPKIALKRLLDTRLDPRGCQK